MYSSGAFTLAKYSLHGQNRSGRRGCRPRARVEQMEKIVVLLLWLGACMAAEKSPINRFSTTSVKSV